MKKFLQSLKKDERGLTLVELLAVVVILAIVGAIAFVAIGNVVENSKKDAHIANAQQIVSAAKLAEASGTDVGTTNTGSITSTADLNTLETIVDPWDTNKTNVGTISKDSTSGEFSITLAGGSGSGAKGCTLTDVSETDLLSEDRKVLCPN